MKDSATNTLRVETAAKCFARLSRSCARWICLFALSFGTIGLPGIRAVSESVQVEVEQLVLTSHELINSEHRRQHVPNECPLTKAPRTTAEERPTTGSHACRHGHRLHNGLMAPMLC